MQKISWQDNNNLSSDEESKDNLQSQNKDVTIIQDKEYNQALQLDKFQDPAKNQQRQSYIALLETFKTLLVSGNVHQIAKDLLTEDFEIFIFNSTGRGLPVQHAKMPQGFVDLFKNTQVQERRVRETNIDMKKHTACQICNYKVVYEDNGNPVDEVACEIFSFRNDKVYKYRGFFGCFAADRKSEVDPLEKTRKDIMLAKVKEINYALAGEPDYEKVASLLDDSVEYKIWRWDDFKLIILYKKDFAESFKSKLEENMSIKCVIPYELSVDSEAKYVSATYLYQLEDKSSKKKYEWLNTCLYRFDEKTNIIKISHQGENHPAGDADIPFEVYTYEKLENKLKGFYSKINLKFDALYTEEVLYNCTFLTFCFPGIPNPGHFQGLKQIDKIADFVALPEKMKVHFAKPVDIYLDLQSQSYDVLFAVLYGQGEDLIPDDKDNEKLAVAIASGIMMFENGKLAKVYEFVSLVQEPIESPFDDKSFQGTNIK